MYMRLARSAGLAALVMASLAGCSTRDGGASETVEQASALLTGTFTLKNYLTGLCLGVQSGYAVAKTCSNGTDQNWQQGAAMRDDPTYFQMVNTSGPFQCLDKVGSYECTGLPGNDYCYYEGIGSCDPSYAGFKPYFTANLGNLNCFRFEDDIVRGLILGTLNGSHANGARAVIAPNTGSMDQVWCLPKAAGGY